MDNRHFFDCIPCRLFEMQSGMLELGIGVLGMTLGLGLVVTYDAAPRRAYDAAPRRANPEFRYHSSYIPYR